jgi:hypothetical protein
MIIQVQLSKRVGAVPISRDYMVDAEREVISGKGRSKPRSAA